MKEPIIKVARRERGVVAGRGAHRAREFRGDAGRVFAILGGQRLRQVDDVAPSDRPQRGAGGEIEIKGVGAPSMARGAPRFGVMFQAGALFGSQTVIETWRCR